MHFGTLAQDTRSSFLLYQRYVTEAPTTGRAKLASAIPMVKGVSYQSLSGIGDYIGGRVSYTLAKH